MLSLRELQLRFASALVPDGDEASGAGRLDTQLVELVERREPLTPAERVAIYAGMYRARLVDVLRDDFPRVTAIVGDEAFQRLAARYLARYPSTHPSVRHVGSRFAEFLATDGGVHPFLADLARLEWARVEVFDAADADPLRLADLQAVSPEEWPALRFRLIPACRMLESTWPVHRIWAQAGESEGGPVDVEPEPTAVRVWREEDGDVSHAAMTAREAEALRLLDRGESFGTLCARLDRDLDPDDAAHEMAGLLMRWLADGLLARPSSRAFMHHAAAGRRRR
ncbi:MAG TPA: DNA-binding domain-containing protein [Candidatus Tectomicrobia bacterium]|nr:DNA-binding domain-containing protein [Candidatus Tectomicrobia bacterium]